MSVKSEIDAGSVRYSVYFRRKADREGVSLTQTLERHGEGYAMAKRTKLLTELTVADLWQEVKDLYWSSRCETLSPFHGDWHCARYSFGVR